MRLISEPLNYHLTVYRRVTALEKGVLSRSPGRYRTVIGNTDRASKLPASATISASFEPRLDSGPISNQPLSLKVVRRR